MSKTMLFRRSSLAVVAVAALVTTSCAASGQSNTEVPDGQSSSDSQWSISANFTSDDGQVSTETYVPLEASDAQEAIRLCLVLPALNFPIWTTANYGSLMEAQRLGIEYSAFDAGGYENLSTQVSQMQDCITQQFDAIIVGAISAEGMCASIEQALDAGIPVVDMINGTDCGDDIETNPLLAHVGVSYVDSGAVVGEYLIETSDGEQRNVVMFPGPDGAGYANDGAAGFSDSVEGSNVQVIADIRGTTAVDTQLQLIEDAIRAYPEMTDIYGVDPAAEAAIVAVRNAGQDLGIYGYSITPAVFEAIAENEVQGAVTDYVPYIGRMAVDTAVRLLSGQPLPYRKVGPVPEIITPDNHAEFLFEDSFAPVDFRSVSHWTP